MQGRFNPVAHPPAVPVLPARPSQIPLAPAMVPLRPVIHQRPVPSPLAVPSPVVVSAPRITRVFLPQRSRILRWVVQAPCVVEKNTPLGYFRNEQSGLEQPFRAPHEGFIPELLVLEGSVVSSDHTLLYLWPKSHIPSQLPSMRVPIPPSVTIIEDRKLVLVLDIDHTLLHSSPIHAPAVRALSKDGNPPGSRIFLQNSDPHCVKFRPYLDEFLDSLSKKYEICLYTQGIRSYAEGLLPILDPDGTRLSRRLPLMCREGSSVQESGLSFDTPATVKSLSKLQKVCGFMVGKPGQHCYSDERDHCAFYGLKGTDHGRLKQPRMELMRKDVVIVDDRRDNWDSEDLPSLLRVPKYYYWPAKEQPTSEQNDSEPSTESASESTPSTLTSRLKFLDNEQWYDGTHLKDRFTDSKPDNILLSSAAVLSAVHECVLRGRRNATSADSRCDHALSSLKRTVLHGCTVLFSGVFPMRSVPEEQPIWRMCEEYGARCSLSFDSNVTHVAAAVKGTSKVNQAKQQGVWAVHLNWLFDSVIHFRRADEVRYSFLFNAGLSEEPMPVPMAVKNPITESQLLSKLHCLINGLPHPDFVVSPMIHTLNQRSAAQVRRLGKQNKKRNLSEMSQSNEMDCQSLKKKVQASLQGKCLIRLPTLSDSFGLRSEQMLKLIQNDFGGEKAGFILVNASQQAESVLVGYEARDDSGSLEETLKSETKKVQSTVESPKEDGEMSDGEVDESSEECEGDGQPRRKKAKT